MPDLPEPERARLLARVKEGIASARWLANKYPEDEAFKEALAIFERVKTRLQAEGK